MTGTCAQRSPWSRLGVLAARAAFVGGVCIGGGLGAVAVASATELPEIDRPLVEVRQPIMDLSAGPEPARTEPELPEPERPDIERPSIENPVPPINETDQPAVVEENGSAPLLPSLAPPPAQQPFAVPPAADRAEPLPEQPWIPDTTARIIPKPRAPDASAPCHIAPLTDPEPQPQAPCAPGTSLSAASACVSGLRGLPVILSAGPSPSDPAITRLAHPETRPTTGILYLEPSMSPD
ncbi:hypothetical protein [Saccharopolyspora phatthalungensis]|uniref:Uncharacterized protein n=1 Tax=Saccharopolyspora phatthalungensis TaxID=664693 RepID=A0A840Q3W0_9PSEU|nr:hypothetical protein [Saccharopolyspora phatthalungensis]MBB5154590.1 hypothetical protein [Saccharopolyspora phatthalungensis]